MFWHRLSYRSFDFVQLLLTLCLMGIGLLSVLSTTHTDTVMYSYFFKKQLVGCCVGLSVYLLLAGMPLVTLSRLGYQAYFFAVGLLLYTYCKGFVVLGARRWISLYFFRGQPSELIKFLLPFFLGYFLYESFIAARITASRSRSWLWGIPLGTLAITVWLIKKQPDLGTSLLVLFQGLGVLWAAGLSRKFFLYGALASVIGAPLIFISLKPYQKRRIYVFCGYGEKKGERYQVEQSLIAIGSGGLWGKGFLKGTQNRFSFLPEDHSDMIFAILCEEWGLVGAILLLLLYLLLSLRILWNLLNRDHFLVHLVGIGQLLHIMLAVLVNIGMVVGVLPIVGVPLPLISYGLSYLLVTMASLGVLQSGIDERHTI